MKILLVNKFHYLKGGSERVYFLTKKILEENGHDVICFSMKDERNLPSDEAKYFSSNIDFSSTERWVGKSRKFICNPEAAKKLKQLIDKEKPDVAHLHNISHQLTPSILKPLRKAGVPIVQTLHDYQMICPNYRLYVKGEVCERCYKHRYYNCFINKCMRNKRLPSLLATVELYLQWIMRTYRQKIDIFISPSQFLQKKLQDWGVKKPIEVVNNFIEMEKFKPNYDNKDYIVCVSRLSEEKGIMTLLAAMRKLPKVKLKLIGDGPDRQKVENYIRSKKLTNVKYLGPKYDQKLFDLIANAKFFIIPSQWYENYPMLVIEAMALGKPVLASQLGGLEEMVIEGHNGWFFRPGSIRDLRSKIEAHWQGEDLVELGKAGRKMVEQKNSSETYYKELMAIYNKLKKSKSKVDFG